MQYLQKLVKLQLVKVVGEDRVEYYYIDFFSQHDFNQIQNLPHKILDEVLLPISHCEAIRDNFRALYVSYETDGVVSDKVAYNLNGDRYKRVRKWIEFYRKFSDDFLPE
ncbi:hypothetical protein [Billgrantia endophytica]|uniref:Uncharacterized protein n=1 Tax=Billgrantia endophytica TaxID=2033802 RepID=A0A2N7TUE0_9GAMM|nr:hypothetical protein [Halomonas endophytica]PMR71812.1 hypothetical protein C1H69_23035 [Halomonas endophytica]